MTRAVYQNYFVQPGDQYRVVGPLNYRVLATEKKVRPVFDSVEHFETLTITMPYVSGVCTIPQGVNWSQGYHTPLTCVESSDAEYIYFFGTPNVPIGFVDGVNVNPIYRQLKTISETTAELMPQRGLSSRPSLKLTFEDFEGDPGPVTKTDTGTYFNKFSARNIFSGRDIEIKRWARTAGVDTLVSSSKYVADAITSTQKGDYVLTAKSHLEKTYKDETQFPEPTGATLRLDIDDVTTSIPVNDSEFDWSTLPLIRIGDELIQSISYDQPTQVITSASRGSSVTGIAGVISTTTADDHSAGDDIQVSDISDSEEISEFLERVLLLAGVPASYIDTVAWQAEFDDYWAGSKIINVWSEPISVKDVLEILCNDYMLDIWEETNEPARISVSAVSVWKAASQEIETGQGITQETLKYSIDEGLRSSRAYIYYDKRDLTDNDDRGNFKKLSLNINTTYEGSDFYGSQKEKELNPSVLLDTNDANLRTQRQTARFQQSPLVYSWETEEVYLTYKAGDIVEFTNRDLTDAQGDPLKVRAQITKVNPKYKYKGVGRGYAVKAMTYTPAIISDEGGEFTKVISNATISEIDIQNDYADRTTAVVDFILILDNCTVVSDDLINPSIRNGGFAAGSTVTIICINGTDWQGFGGIGGNGARWFFDEEPPAAWDQLVPAKQGGDGGICFNADGVDTEIFLEGATGNATYPTADGYLRAPGGGGGGSGGNVPGDPGDGGGGGAGIVIGLGGAAGDARDPGEPTEYGEQGLDGLENGNGGAGGGVTGGDGGDWGAAGVGGLGIGGANPGAAGSGLIKSGATVTIQYTNPARFINGNGEAPD